MGAIQAAVVFFIGTIVIKYIIEMETQLNDNRHPVLEKILNMAGMLGDKKYMHLYILLVSGCVILFFF